MILIISCLIVTILSVWVYDSKLIFDGLVLFLLLKDVQIGQRMITISTVGVPNTIKKLASYKLQSTLAIRCVILLQKWRMLFWIFMWTTKMFIVFVWLLNCSSKEHMILKNVSDFPIFYLCYWHWQTSLYWSLFLHLFHCIIKSKPSNVILSILSYVRLYILLVLYCLVYQLTCSKPETKGNNCTKCKVVSSGCNYEGLQGLLPGN